MNNFQNLNKIIIKTIKINPESQSNLSFIKTRI